VHADGEVQATVFRKANWALAGVGVGWMRHVVPLHPSARVPALETPTAVQADVDAHATLVRKPPPCAGLGVGWMVHLVPFHRSARVPALEPPTAVQADADMQDTPLKPPPPGAGLGVGWMVHLVPFHRSARVPAFDVPTAVHADADVQDTPFKKPPPCGGLGVGWMVHLVPFHRSARARAVPAAVVLAPTAMQAEADVQTTPNRPLTAIPEGLGVGRMRQELPFHCSARLTPSPEALT
jgi:hypothetical protein